VFGKRCALPTGSLCLVVGVCVPLVISGELAPEERLRVADSCLATAVNAFWQRSEIPRPRGKETLRGDVAWAGRTETLQRFIVTMFVFIVELSRTTHPIRGSFLGTMPAVKDRPEGGCS
jgi:hypothetical protein